MPKKQVLLAALLLAVCLAAHANPALEAAQRAFEDGRHEECLAQLQAIERKAGRNPRTESIRALALDALGRHREAYLSTLAYLSLSARQKLEDNSAHAAMLALRDATRTRLEAEKAAERARLDREREAQAEEVVAAEAQRVQAHGQALVKDSAAGLLAARTRGGDARGFEAGLTAVLGAEATARVGKQLREAAQARARALVGAINTLMSGQVSRELYARPITLAADARERSAPYRLSAFHWDGRLIDYRMASHVRGVPLEENGTVQGFELAQLLPGKGMEIVRGELGTELRFQLRQQALWLRGTARYGDGRPYTGALSSTRGTAQLSLWLPGEAGEELGRAFAELISLYQQQQQR